MAPKSNPTKKGGKKGPGIFSLLKPYKKMILLLLLLALLSNGINLALPKIIAKAIDAYPVNYSLRNVLTEYLSLH